MDINQWISKNKRKASSNEEFSFVLDYLKRELSNKKSINFNYEQALSKAKKNKTQSKKHSGLVENIIEFDNEIKIVKLLDKTSKDWDGKFMSNCLSKYSTENSIYSLRDSKERPHATIEISTNLSLKQIKGYRNGLVSLKYTKMIVDFLKTITIKYLDIQDSYLGNIGLVPLRNKNIIEKYFNFETVFLGNIYFFDIHSFKNIKRIDKNFIKEIKKESSEPLIIDSIISYALFERNEELINSFLLTKDNYVIDCIIWNSCLNNDEKTFKKILEFTSKVNILDKIFNRKKIIEYHNYLLEKMLNYSIRLGKPNLLTIIKSKDYVFYKKNKKLEKAIANNQLNIVDYLLAEDLISEEDLYAGFFLTCKNENVFLAKKILEKGIDLNKDDVKSLFYLIIGSLNYIHKVTYKERQSRKIFFIEFLISNGLDLSKMSIYKKQEIEFYLTSTKSLDILNFLKTKGLYET